MLGFFVRGGGNLIRFPTPSDTSLTLLIVPTSSVNEMEVVILRVLRMEHYFSERNILVQEGGVRAHGGEGEAPPPKRVRAVFD
jgi:hypothetical protein